MSLHFFITKINLKLLINLCLVFLIIGCFFLTKNSVYAGACEEFSKNIAEGGENTKWAEKYICTNMLEPIPYNKDSFASFEEVTKGTKSLCIDEKGKTLIENDEGSCFGIASPTGFAGFKAYIAFIYKWAVDVVGILSVVMLIAYGILYATSGSSETGATEAKKRILQIFLGLALLFLIGFLLRILNPTFFQ